MARTAIFVSLMTSSKSTLGLKRFFFSYTGQELQRSASSRTWGLIHCSVAWQPEVELCPIDFQWGKPRSYQGHVISSRTPGTKKPLISLLWALQLRMSIYQDDGGKGNKVAKLKKNQYSLWAFFSITAV